MVSSFVGKANAVLFVQAGPEGGPGQSYIRGPQCRQAI